ncbi:competence protein, partial [Antarcticimicrobium luteum]
MGVPTGVAARLDAALDRQRGHLFPWAPVCLGLGIGFYFTLAAEPGRWVFLITAIIAAAGAAAALVRPGGAAALGWAAALVAAGLGLAAG